MLLGSYLEEKEIWLYTFLVDNRNMSVYVFSCNTWYKIFSVREPVFISLMGYTPRAKLINNQWTSMTKNVFYIVANYGKTFKRWGVCAKLMMGTVSLMSLKTFKSGFAV